MNLFGGGVLHPGWPTPVGPLRVAAGVLRLRPVRMRDAGQWSRTRIADREFLEPWEPTAEVDWMAEKVASLRLFSDAQDKMNLGLDEVGGGILVISQFTLYGDAAKGRRPSFIDAARPEVAIPLYERFVAALRAKGLKVETGEFGAMMQVEIHNDGPVTLVLEKQASSDG